MIIKCKFDFSVVAMGEWDPSPDQVSGKRRYEVFGQEDVYFFGETGRWVTEKIGKPKWKVVAPEELWRWSKELLELIVSGKRRSESLEGRDISKNSS